MLYVFLHAAELPVYVLDHFAAVYVGALLPAWKLQQCLVGVTKQHSSRQELHAQHHQTAKC
jgi:hypothetical protein